MRSVRQDLPESRHVPLICELVIFLFLFQPGPERYIRKKLQNKATCKCPLSVIVRLLSKRGIYSVCTMDGSLCTTITSGGSNLPESTLTYQSTTYGSAIFGDTIERLTVWSRKNILSKRRANFRSSNSRS